MSACYYLSTWENNQRRITRFVLAACRERDRSSPNHRATEAFRQLTRDYLRLMQNGSFPMSSNAQYRRLPWHNDRQWHGSKRNTLTARSMSDASFVLTVLSHNWLLVVDRLRIRTRPVQALQLAHDAWHRTLIYERPSYLKPAISHILVGSEQ